MVALLVAAVVLLTPELADGNRRACCLSRYLPSIMVILHHRVGGPATAAVLANAIPGLAGFGAALLTLHLTAALLGIVAALFLGLGVSVVWNAAVFGHGATEPALEYKSCAEP